MEELFMMRRKEIDRLTVIQSVLKKQLSWRQAAEQLGMCVRQVGYMCARVKREGISGIRHRLKGRPSNHRLPEDLIREALKIVKERYPDFGPTFANEKLRKEHGIEISISTLRSGMIGTGLWKAGEPKIRHRHWRQRRACLGELVQLDGSYHAWFERRGPKCVLLVYIDDATSRILHAQFVESEDAVNLLKATERYLKNWGRPLALYVDRDSIYTTTRQTTMEEEFKQIRPATQFTRAMNELGIEVQTAYSPQAKGRVERGFKTHQDRLVKELRLRGIATLEEANAYLEKEYIAEHNQRCMVEPENSLNAHRRLLKSQKLDQILSLQYERTVFSDYTIRFENRAYQILPSTPLLVRPKDKVTVEWRLDGGLHIRAQGHYLDYKRLGASFWTPLKRKVNWDREKPKPGTLNYAKRVYVGPWTIERKTGSFHEVKI